MPIQSLRPGKAINLLVFADPGWGKTRLAGSSPGKTLILRPPQDHTDSILKADRASTKEWVLNDWDDMWEAMEFCRHDGKQFDWIWLDSISLLQDIGLDDIWNTVITEKPARKRYGLDKQEYGINMFRLSQLIRQIVAAGEFNFGVTAHPAELAWSEDEETMDKLMPWVQGKNMAPKISGYMNMVAFGDQTDSGKRQLHFTATSRYYAKDQFDAFPKGKLLDPTMPKIVDAIDKTRPAAKATGTSKTRRAGTSRRRTTK